MSSPTKLHKVLATACKPRCVFRFSDSAEHVLGLCVPLHSDLKVVFTLSQQLKPLGALKLKCRRFSNWHPTALVEFAGNPGSGHHGWVWVLPSAARLGYLACAGASGQPGKRDPRIATTKQLCKRRPDATYSP